MSDKARLVLVGGFRLLDAGGHDRTPPTRKLCALLGYLAVTPNKVVRREQLMSLLWSERGERQARDSLRQCLMALRRVEARLGRELVSVGNDLLQLAAANLTVDLDELDVEISGRRIARLKRLLGAGSLDLLAGYDDVDPALSDWLLVERERFATRTAARLVELLRDHPAPVGDRIDLTNAILRLDPYLEDAARLHMEALAAEDNKAAALVFFQQYVALLRRDYDVAPSATLTALADRLRRPTDHPPSLQPAVPPVRRRSAEPPRIGVIADTMVGADEELGYLAQALGHDLLSTLARFKEWIALPLVPDEREAEQLALRGIHYRLSCRLIGIDQRRVVDVQLVDSEDGSTLLADRLDLGQAEWVSMLNDLCCRIAGRLHMTVPISRLRKVIRTPTAGRSAYDLWVEAYHLHLAWRRRARDRAAALYKQAIEADPNLACAYSGLTSIYNTRWLCSPGWPHEAEDLEQAHSYARRAMEIDPLDPRSQLGMAWCHYLARRYDCAELHFKIAINLNPSNPDILINAASAAAFGGRPGDALEYSRRAFHLNPIPRSSYWGIASNVDFFRRDFAGCVAKVRRAPAAFLDVQAWTAASLAHLGRVTEAAIALRACYDTLRADWAGPAAPTDGTLHHWLCTTWRIRLPEDSQLLADGLDLAAAAINQIPFSATGSA